MHVNKTKKTLVVKFIGTLKFLSKKYNNTNGVKPSKILNPSLKGKSISFFLGKTARVKQNPEINIIAIIADADHNTVAHDIGSCRKAIFFFSFF